VCGDGCVKEEGKNKGGRRTPCNQKKNGAAEAMKVRPSKEIEKFTKKSASLMTCGSLLYLLSNSRDVCALRDANSSCLPFPNPPPLVGGKQKALHHVAQVLLRSQFLSCPQFRTVNFHILFLDN